VKTAVVVNPAAGGGRAGRVWPRVLKAIGPCECAVSERPGHVETLTRDFLRAGFTRIVAVGGDGTLYEAVNGFFNGGLNGAGGAALGIVPAGTAADFARLLSIPLNASAAAQRLLHASPRPIDVGCIALAGSTRCFVNVASVGLGAEFARRVAQWRFPPRGRFRYLAATLAAVASMEPPRLEIDDAPARPYLHLAIGNGRYAGGGINLCPLALTGDGELDVTLIGPVSVLEAARSLRLLYGGRIHSHPAVRHMRVPSIAIRGAALVEADGEVCGALPATFSVLPRALRVLA
jgi:YegS/Rv2252/BmrU family lipid kinase